MIICLKCQAQNPPNSHQCQNCGSDLLPGETFKDRIGTFIIGIVAGVVGLIAFYFLASHPQIAESREFCLLTSPAMWLFVGVVSPISGTITALRKTPEFQRYKNRAERHKQPFPEQAVEDYTKAIELAPAKEKAPLIKARADLYKQMGKEEESLKDQLEYMTTEGAYESSASFARLLGADKDTFISSAINDDRKKLIAKAKIKGVAFCVKGEHTVELDEKLKCSAHPKSRLLNATFVMPNELVKTIEEVENTSRVEFQKTKKRRWIIWAIVGVLVTLCVIIPAIAAIFAD